MYEVTIMHSYDPVHREGHHTNGTAEYVQTMMGGSKS
jgi:hypothetical protein